MDTNLSDKEGTRIKDVKKVSEFFTSLLNQLSLPPFQAKIQLELTYSPPERPTRLRALTSVGPRELPVPPTPVAAAAGVMGGLAAAGTLQSVAEEGMLFPSLINCSADT